MHKTTTVNTEESEKHFPERDDESNTVDYSSGHSFYSEERGLTFNPPVYIQRYASVVNCLADPRWKRSIHKVVDMGCAELGFFMSLKQVEGMREIVAVDIDRDLLESCSSRVIPLTTDYLRMRDHDLVVTVMAGSVAEYDKCLDKTDAVICIELIEHLFPPELEALPYNILGQVKPRIAIFTTPNSDFNILFPGLGAGFRHPDHKFEWSRMQFEDWASNLVQRFPDYNIEFQGIGRGPGNSESTVGCCSQMVVFWRPELPEPIHLESPTDAQAPPHKMVKHSEYTVVRQAVYPARRDERTPALKARHDAEYELHMMASEERFEGPEIGESFVPLSELLKRVAKSFNSEADLKVTLEEAGYICKTMPDGSVCVHYINKESSSEEEEPHGEDLCTAVWSPKPAEDWDEEDAKWQQETQGHASPDSDDADTRWQPKPAEGWDEPETQWQRETQDHTSQSPDSDWEMTEATPRAWQSEPQLQQGSPPPKDHPELPLMFRSVNEKQIFGLQRMASSPDDAVRVDDSGYPNSASVQDMDVTLGSSDELSSNRSSSVCSGSSSPGEEEEDGDPVMPRNIPPPPLVHHFRPEPIPANNHDAVNNNRDGEGNDLGLEVPHQPRPQPGPRQFPRWLLMVLAEEWDEGFEASSSEDEDDEEEEDRHFL